MGARRRGRELAFQALFQMDLGHSGINYVLGHFEDLKKANEETKSFAEELARGTSEHLESIDREITLHSKNWDFKRLNTVDKALMRLGCFELLHREEIPAEVTLNECIEMAKRFGSEDSPAFVNGILDQIRKDSAPKKIFKEARKSKASKPRRKVPA